MAKKQGVQDSSPEVGGRNEKREKKLAKREAKAMLAVDQARIKLEKAEKKLANAQLRTEKRKADLQAVEAHLAELRNTHQSMRAAANGATPGMGTTQESQEATAEQQEMTETGYDELPEEHPSSQEEQEELTGTSNNDAETEEQTAGSGEASSEAEAVSHEEDTPETEVEAPAGANTEDSEQSDAAANEEEETAASVAEAAPAGEQEAPAQGGESDQTRQPPWWQRNPVGQEQEGS